MFYSFCWWLCMIWIRVMYHVEIVGRENVPRDRGYILAANHRTNMGEPDYGSLCRYCAQ